jgi:hypothetical protein
LVIGSQCAAAPALSFLPELAQDLAKVLIDPVLGGACGARRSPRMISPGG